MNFIVSRIQHEITAVRVIDIRNVNDALEQTIDDIEIANLIQFIKDGSMEVENAVVEGDELRMVNSKLDDYGVIALGETEDDDSIVRDGIVILYNLVDPKTQRTVGYTVSDPAGNVADYSCAEMVDIANRSAIVNADTINNAGNLKCVPRDKAFPKMEASFEVDTTPVISAKNETVAPSDVVELKVKDGETIRTTKCGVGAIDNVLKSLGINDVRMEKRIDDKGESFYLLTRGLPDSIITEANYNLIEIDLPSSVEIGYNVFANVRSLKRVGCSSATIGKGAFMMCTNLKRVECFDVVEIEDLAFFGCSELFDIILPNTLKKIGYNAFDACGITSLNIPNSVETMNSMAFANCPDLRDVTVPVSLMKVWAKTCKDFNTAVANKTLTYETSPYLGTFANCTSLTTINLSAKDIVRIGDYQFKGCKELMRIAKEQSV